MSSKTRTWKKMLREISGQWKSLLTIVTSLTANVDPAVAGSQKLHQHNRAKHPSKMGH